MTNELRKIYGAVNKLDRYSDKSTPCDLFRGLKKGSKFGLMTPTLIGFVSKRGARLPDVFVADKDNNESPQFKNTQGKKTLATESKSMPVTTDMIRNGDLYVVKGCRTMHGDFRGLSVFNAMNEKLPFDWHLITESTNIPEGLAVTRDYATVSISGATEISWPESRESQPIRSMAMIELSSETLMLAALAMMRDIKSLEVDIAEMDPESEDTWQASEDVVRSTRALGEIQSAYRAIHSDGYPTWEALEKMAEND